MAFRSPDLPERIRAARGVQQGAIDASPTSTVAGVAQKAKLSASKWANSNMDGPRDFAAPWFEGRQPFTELRAASGNAFGAWKDRFSQTDMGYNFAPPPPEPTSDQPEVV